MIQVIRPNNPTHELSTAKKMQRIKEHLRKMHHELTEIMFLMEDIALRDPKDHQEIKKIVSEMEQMVNKARINHVFKHEWITRKRSGDQLPHHPGRAMLTDHNHIQAVDGFISTIEHMLCERLAYAPNNSMTYLDTETIKTIVEEYDPQHFFTIAIFKGDEEAFEKHCKWWAGAVHRPDKPQ